jgi:hypothetical protein
VKEVIVYIDMDELRSQIDAQVPAGRTISSIAPVSVWFAMGDRLAIEFETTEEESGG